MDARRHIIRSRSAFFLIRLCGFFRLRPHNAVGRRRKRQHLLQGIAGQRHAGLRVDLGIRKILSHQRRQNLFDQIRSQSGGFLMRRDLERGDHTAVHRHVRRHFVHAADGIGIPRGDCRGGRLFAGRVFCRLREGVIDGV